MVPFDKLRTGGVLAGQIYLHSKHDIKYRLLRSAFLLYLRAGGAQSSSFNTPPTTNTPATATSCANVRRWRRRIFLAISNPCFHADSYHAISFAERRTGSASANRSR